MTFKVLSGQMHIFKFYIKFTYFSYLVCTIILGNFFPKQKHLFISFQFFIHTLINSFTNCQLLQEYINRKYGKGLFRYYRESLPYTYLGCLQQRTQI